MAERKLVRAKAKPYEEWPDWGGCACWPSNPNYSEFLVDLSDIIESTSHTCFICGKSIANKGIGVMAVSGRRQGTYINIELLDLDEGRPDAGH